MTTTNATGAETATQGIWLNIGCGRQHLKGFINMDVDPPYDVRLDATQGLPYEEQTVDGIYSEHFFEHLSQVEGLRFLRECRRVLKPNGVIRIAMPDLDEEVRRYNSEDWRGDGDMFKLGFDWVSTRCEMLNIGMREWGHQYLYNEEELIRITEIAGLQSRGRLRRGESQVPQFVNRETRDGSILIMEFSIPDRAVSASPLVSVVIPAYRVTWFEEAFTSAQEQSYRNIEILVCDDSQDGVIESIVKTAATNDPRIRYIRNTPALGSAENLLKCVALAKGEFVKPLNDDDLLAPTCVEKMLSAFKEHPSVSLVTSYRKSIDEKGQPMPDMAATRRLSTTDIEFEGISCGNALIAYNLNFVGEPTSAMFRKSDLDWVKPNFLTYAGRLAIGAGDAAMWLHLLGRGNAFYLADPQSSFRRHSGQEQHLPSAQAQGRITWMHLKTHGLRLGIGKDFNDVHIKGRMTSSAPWQKFFFSA